MPRKDLVSLSIAALNDTEHIRHLQKLVEVCLDQMSNPEEDTIDKLFLILDSYRASMDNHLHELEVALINLRLLLVGTEQDHGN